MSRYQTLMSRIDGGIDALLITSEKNQHYLGGFPFSDGYLLLTRQDALLLTDSRYVESAEREAYDEFTVLTMKGGLAATAMPYLDKVGAKVIGYEDSFLTCAELARLKRTFPEMELVPIGSVIEDMRIYKDEGELGKIISAQRIAEGALEHLLRVITPNMTEIEVAAELDYRMARLGSTGVSF